ncbi:hypothetical protein G6F68_011221 [Rhizopus microsporus]|nr:hypothetical protein G6F68_011221 [Rhizopus microsporus]
MDAQAHRAARQAWPRPGRAGVPGSEGPVQGLRRRGSHQQGGVLAGARLDRVADRAQRRGQDHDPEPVVRAGCAGRGQHPLQEQADGGPVGQRDRGLRHRPHVPEPEAVRRPDRA